MKREILFKGKRVDNGEWVFGYLIKNQLHNKFDSPHSLMYEKWYIDKGSDINLFDGIFHQVEVHTETVCQFTGLLDKNGKRIFEGDILKHTYKNDVGGKVSFFQGSFIVGTAISSNSLINFNTCNYLEIIGNVHD